MSTTKKIPSPLVSFLPIVLLIGMLFATIRTFGSDALSGGSQISLLTTTAVCVFIGVAFYRIPWRDYEIAITNNVAGVTSAIIILLIIGALSGAWMISGVVPTLIYYGMQIIHPDFFLTSTCVICALVSIMTGSSWTTIATIGIALLGIGKAQGFEEGWIAGAIISGAYFGDKVSPLSDTTVLAASVTDTPLFRHIRYMMITTIPSLVITLVIFTVMGFACETSGTEQIAEFTASLNARFHITPWLLIVPVVTGILIARKVPSIITLFLSTLLAATFAIIFQPELLHEISGNNDLFEGTMMSLYGSTNLQSDSAMLTELIATRSNPERGFKLLIDFFQQPIYWHIRRLVVSHEDAEDILQEVFIRVFRHLPQFREESSLGTWIYRIATNECLRFFNMLKEQYESQLYNWRSKQQNQQTSSERELEMSTEIARLKRQLAERDEELAILQKAATYFAKRLK